MKKLNIKVLVLLLLLVAGVQTLSYADGPPPGFGDDVSDGGASGGGGGGSGGSGGGSGGPGGGGGPAGGAGVPLDAGMSLLLAAGAGYGLKKYNDMRKGKQAASTQK